MIEPQQTRFEEGKWKPSYSWLLFLYCVLLLLANLYQKIYRRYYLHVCFVTDCNESLYAWSVLVVDVPRTVLVWQRSLSSELYASRRMCYVGM